MKELIRRDHFILRKSIRQIARERHVARKTIRAALRDATPTTYKRKKEPNAPVLGPFKAIIRQILETDLKMPPKQRHTSKRLFERLRDEYGYQGAESTVRRFVGQIRPTLKDTFVPLEFDPGTDAQCDWGTADVILAGEQLSVQMFCLKLRSSGAIFVCCFPNQKQEALFEGHVRAFEFFGGIPHRIAYDNPSTLVTAVLKGRNRVENEAFTAFRSHHLFESHFCTPGKKGAHEKGGVENLVGYARRNFLVPLPEVDSLEQLNDSLLARCLDDQQRHLKGAELTIAEALVLEKPVFHPLPDRRYLCCKRHELKADSTALVSFETNRYSVPVEHAHKRVVLKAFVDKVVIALGDQVIATHARSYGKHQEVFDPLHYLRLLEKRPGAFAHAKPLRRWEWAPVLDHYHDKLKAHVPEGRGTREFIRVLGLHKEFSAEQVETAVKLALEYRAYGYDALKNLLIQLSTPAESPRPLDLTGREHLAVAAVGDFKPGQYDALLGGDAA